MEFSKKLQKLRQQKNLTQEGLAQKLFVSRTAVSKWESGRGTPSIDSLKRIADLFSISIDELLSGEELLTLAQCDKAKKSNQFKDMFFGMLDISSIMLLFLPFFAQKSGDTVSAVSLLSLGAVSVFLKFVYIILVGLTVLTGVLTLAFQNCQAKLWVKTKRKLSLALNVFTALLFTVGLYPYAAVFSFTTATIKVLTLINKQ